MKTNEITTLQQLADFINSRDSFPLEAFDIIERNGWTDETHTQWGVCSSDTDRVVLKENAHAEVVPK